MSEKDDSSDERNLMVGERINWPFILGKSVLKFQEAVIKVEGEQSEQEIRESSIVMATLIPDNWTKADKEYKKDKKKAIVKRKVDIRKEWCGRKIGKPKFKVEKVTDPYALAHACVNVFQRRGLLSKTIFTEKIVPQPEDFEEEKT
ncbi:MAG: hypothetical protein ACFFDN_51685 [Candidatus Hodarchaeota archaeon]